MNAWGTSEVRKKSCRSIKDRGHGASEAGILARDRLGAVRLGNVEVEGKA